MSGCAPRMFSIATATAQSTSWSPPSAACSGWRAGKPSTRCWRRRPRAGPTAAISVADLTPGVACALSPLVRRVLAPNPGVMTGPGTNTYLVGVDEIAVIDPGPDDADHLDAIAACGGDRIRWIVVTHHHSDHAPGAAGLHQRTGAPVLAYGERDSLRPDEIIDD